MSIILQIVKKELLGVLEWRVWGYFLRDQTLPQWPSGINKFDLWWNVVPITYDTFQTLSVVLLVERERVQHPMYYVIQILTGAKGIDPMMDKLDFALKMVAYKL